MPRIEPTRIEILRPNGPVAGLLFMPIDPVGSVPLVLLGHGAHTGKDDPVMQILARQLCRGVAAAVLLIDCPAHGERAPDLTHEARELQVRTALADPQVRAELAADWSEAAQAARRADGRIDARTGYAGFSMGTAYGFTVVPALDEVTCALLAIGGLFDEHDPDPAGRARSRAANDLMRAGAAAFADREVVMLNMTHDEHFPMPGALEVFGLLSGPRRMGVWPGTHTGIGAEAMAMGVAFLRRCLGT